MQFPRPVWTALVIKKQKTSERSSIKNNLYIVLNFELKVVVAASAVLFNLTFTDEHKAEKNQFIVFAVPKKGYRSISKLQCPYFKPCRLKDAFVVTSDV